MRVTMRVAKNQQTEQRCETGRKIILPRLATGRIFEALERQLSFELQSAA